MTAAREGLRGDLDMLFQSCVGQMESVDIFSGAMAIRSLAWFSG